MIPVKLTNGIFHLNEYVRSHWNCPCGQKTFTATPLLIPPALILIKFTVLIPNLELRFSKSCRSCVNLNGPTSLLSKFKGSHLCKRSWNETVDGPKIGLQIAYILVRRQFWIWITDWIDVRGLKICFKMIVWLEFESKQGSNSGIIFISKVLFAIWIIETS